ncbi:MAG: ferrous iron transport protein A [Clostridia bacterium]|nr:ferrous iron transport protein A [Clostridia bacterium]
MDTALRLCDIAPGDSCVVRELTTTGSMRRRLLDIGLVENTPVYCIGKSPGGDPAAYLICGAVIAIRATDAATVLVSR